MGRLHLLFNIGLHRRVKILNGVFFALEGEYICCTLLSLFEIQIFDCVKRAVLMGTKSCTKILNFSTRFSCENLDVEDFVTLLRAVLMGTKSCTKILILPKIFPTRFRFTFYG